MTEAQQAAQVSGQVTAEMSAGMSQTDLTTGAAGLYVADDGALAPRAARSRRIGVDYAGPWAARRLRFFVPRHPSVSGPRSSRVT